MHELKREYTIVIVTHNMQQAARVADMTAFFSVEVREDGDRPSRDPRRVRPDDEDLHQPVRQAHRGLRHRAVRMSVARVEFQEELDALEATLQEEGELVLRALRGALNALEHAGRRALRRGDRLRRRDRRARTTAIEQVDRGAARPADAGRDRPPARARDAAHNSIHLERMGDHCVTIAKLTKLAADARAAHGRSSRGSRRWARGRRRWCGVALDSFADRDVERGARRSSTSTS